MLKNLRKKAPEKDKLGVDLFKYFKVAEHGFPHKPSAVAYDPSLQLLAIGTRTGQLKVFGQPGVELVGQSSSTAACVQQLFFLENQGRIVSVCDDGEQNSLHLWEINNPYGNKSILEEVKACILEGRLKKISVCCLSAARECLYIGTEGGHIYTLDLISFELKDHVIYQDIVMQSLTSDSNKNGGSVEGLQEHPTHPEQLLIGYKKGIIVLWNQDKIKAEASFMASQDVESIYWHNGSEQFISAHEHGSLSIWSINDDGDVKQENITPFGPFPCKAIRKVEWHDSLVLFSGGLPRAQCSDKHSISILEDNTIQVALDFTSKIVDFFSITDVTNPTGKPLALVVLCEEEIVFIDVACKDKSFPCFNKPYLACIHSSNITASHHVVNCPEPLWNYIEDAGRKQATESLSTKAWPVSGGKSLKPVTEQHDLMVTGHEDGTVKFWNVSNVSFQLMFTISTSKLFESDFDGAPPPEDDEEEWPRFKKVGNFDPFSDDPRFVIQKILLCPVSKKLFIGGSGGQIVIYELQDSVENQQDTLQVSELNVIEKLEGFEWKGLGPLTVNKQVPSTIYGPTPKRILQIKPSAPITALAMEMSWGLLAAGTCHGLIVFDVISNKVALTKCTVNPTDLANTGAGIQRKRTLAKSLRDSFRRLKSRRGSRRKPKSDDPESSSSPSHAKNRYEVAPQTRLIDESRVDEAVLSMVRCLYFGQTFLGDVTHPTPTLWAGTNAGYIYVYSVNVPENDERNAASIKTEVGKELKLKHHAPVVNIFVVDRNGVPIGSIAEAEKGRICQWDMSGGHSVVISSEEQFKIFALPTLRPRNKCKLTAIDGSRVRKLGIVEVKDKQEHLHHCLVCLTNQGDATMYTVPHLKVQMKCNVMKKEDISAISSLLFTRLGEGFFLKSPSELQRFCLLTGNVVNTDTIISLPPGMRPDEEMLSDNTSEAPQSPISITSTKGNHINSNEVTQVNKE